MTSSPTQNQQPQVTFQGLILGFSSAALHYMGESTFGQEEGAPPAEKNADLARQNIDIIEMLKSKTQGNLEADEDKFMQQIVGDLKLRFAQHFS